MLLPPDQCSHSAVGGPRLLTKRGGHPGGWILEVVAVLISSRDTLDENLGLVEIKVQASVLLEYMLDVREHL